MNHVKKCINKEKKTQFLQIPAHVFHFVPAIVAVPPCLQQARGQPSRR